MNTFRRRYPSAFALLCLTLFAALGLGATVPFSTVVANGDLSGHYPGPTVAKLNGTTITTGGGALATGAVLRTTGTAAADWGAVNLASTAAVTGTLPKGNQGAQDMGGDVSGSTAAATVAKVNGITYPSGSLTTGTIPRATGTATVAYGALDLANSSAVTGLLPIANVASGFLKADGTVSLTGALNANTHQINSVSDATSAQDAVTLNQLRTVRAITAKAHADSPYTLASTVEILQLDTSTGTIQVNLPDPASLRTGLIKDVGGAASTSNITLHRFASEKIENVAADKTLTLNYGTWGFWSDGTNYWITGY